ncbi:MAG TPA: ribosome biogenesis GTP-binding protein YihA/YsxC [Steroidobacteraceae bacterium]|nr:ribosome biogenesis GTP-binding protein YihA/YsxC [Steroidobacteraceae bacterium]
MQFPHARFLLGVHQPSQFPGDDGAEVVFAGRSNAGKSSALNVIVGRTSLARTSKTPGRTQQLNFFEFRPGCRVVDLPGYGYAKVPVPMRRHWQALLDAYFKQRQSLRGVIQIMDVRHPLTDYDIELIEFANGRGVAVHVLLTKADKLSRSQQMLTLKKVEAALEGASVQLFSAPKKIGVDEAREALEQMWKLEAASG